MEIILASGSPRRRELLALAGIEYKVIPSECDETLPQNISPGDAVRLLAQRKAEDVFNKHEDALIIGADTVVALDGKILGKPKDRENAKEMLLALSGKTHEVYTGVALISKNKKEIFSCRSLVEFYPLTEKEINNYIKTGEPMDKAGAYGIQGRGFFLVKGISGDYNNIVGLPLSETVRKLEKFKTE